MSERVLDVIKQKFGEAILKTHSQFGDDVLSSDPFEQSLGLRFTLWMVALSPLVTRPVSDSITPRATSSDRAR